MSGYRPLGGILHGQGIDVSISFSSGFSCQDAVNSVAFRPDGKDTMFPSRNRAAFHVRATQSRMYHPWGTSVCFHLVIERLLISGQAESFFTRQPKHVFQSRYRAASHFRFLSSRSRSIATADNVSISLSSGFSFQAVFAPATRALHRVSISLSSGFSFQGTSTSTTLMPCIRVSISLSSGFSFQVAR